MISELENLKKAVKEVEGNEEVTPSLLLQIEMMERDL